MLEKTNSEVENLTQYYQNRFEALQKEYHEKFDALKTEDPLKFMTEDSQTRKKNSIDEKFEKLRKEINQKFENEKIAVDEIIDLSYLEKETYYNSVKPGTIITIKKRKVKPSKKAIAVGVCAFLIAGKIMLPTAEKILKTVGARIELNKIVNEELADFKKTVIAPNTTYSVRHNNETGVIEEIHWHDPNGIIKGAAQADNDPIVAFYLIYNGLDEWCRANDLDLYIEKFNNLYETTYKDFNDFLVSNHFASTKEWENYAENKLKEEKEISLNGSSNFGR